MISTKDRCRGALFGLAVGDALGCPVEFKRRGSFPPVTGYQNGGPHGLNAGEWTDDTSLALALADSIKEKGWDLTDQITRYVQWYETGKYSVNGICFDIGGTTRSALENFMRTGDVATSGLKEAYASGNGGIMRISPVAINYHSLYPKEIGRLFTLGAESSMTTHASTMCVNAAGYMTVVLAALINGKSKEEVLDEDWFDGYAQDLEEAKQKFGYYSVAAGPIRDVIRGSYKDAIESEIKGSGFVGESLEAALWSFWHSKDFREAVLKSIMLGDDTDTTGAVCGQFAGAFYGESCIPQEWLDGLAKKEMIERVLEWKKLS
jgi:ADP-ribosyl-[dinitrogen reductase] hydrolase